MKHILTVFAALLVAGSLHSQQLNYQFPKGFDFKSSDSNFHIKGCGRVQTLFTASSKAGSSDWDNDLIIRRARLKFDGHLFDPRLSFKLEFGLSNRDRSVKNDALNTIKVPAYILDAVVKYKATKYMEIWAGQTKLPGNRERVVSSQNLQLVDRSVVNSIFNLDREVGVQLRFKEKIGNAVIKQMGSVSLGEGRNAWFANLGGYHYSLRGEYLPFGDFEDKGDYFQSDLSRELSPKLAFGATFSYNDNAARQKATGQFLTNEDGDYLQSDLATLLIDATFKYRGFSALMEVAHKQEVQTSEEMQHYYSELPAGDLINQGFYTGSGINLQAGYLFKKNFELSSRFTRVVPNSATSFKGMNEYTVGVSQYFYGHKLKVQSDFAYSDYDQLEVSDKLRFRLQVEIGF